MDVMVRVPGSCGELVQGYWQGEPFLVTCPINRYTTVHVSSGLAGCCGLGRKASLALQAVCRHLGKERLPWGIRLTSELPRGKGMASSSADIAAVIAAVSLAWGKPLPVEEILQLAVRIEPTDGTFFRGIVCLDQLHGRLRQSYHLAGRLPLTVFDTGGTVDTVAFHREAAQEAPAYSKLQMQGIQQLLRSGTAQGLAAAATRSALLHQAVLPKPCLPELLADAQSLGALGLNVAHSGTVIGIFWPPAFPASQIVERAGILQERYDGLSLWGQAYLQGGGIGFLRKEEGEHGTFCSWRQYL